MLSGIWDLEWKCVKKLGQRSSTLFTSAQEICNLAYEFCTNGLEKGHTPFVKVVEGSVVHNFGIQTLGHFSWKNWRKSRLNRDTRIWTASVRAHARRRALGRVGRAADRAWTTVPRCDRRSQGLVPTFAPIPTLPRATRSRATRNRLTPTHQRHRRRTRPHARTSSPPMPWLLRPLSFLERSIYFWAAVFAWKIEM
jgi:hypothetical protein